MVLDYRLLLPTEGDAASRIHRTAGAMIPGYDTSLHSETEFKAFYRDKVMVDGPVWGALHGSKLLGFVALLPGWIEHLYVDPQYHKRGIGGELVRLAQREQHELRLHTFQANVRARRFYEQHGFVIEELNDGQRNEEKMPDVTYFWAHSQRSVMGVSDSDRQ